MYARVQGSCVEFRQFLPPSLRAPPPRRTEIGPFSAGSRMRLLRYVNKIDWHRLPGSQFVLLTYPDKIDHRDMKARAVDRYVFLRYVEKLAKKHVPCIWRVEWMPRLTGERIGELMPHWHLLLMGCPKLSKRWVRETWRKTIGHDRSFLKVGWKEVWGELGAVKYLAKYVSKQSDLAIEAYHNKAFAFGRHWGITRKDEIPMQPIYVLRRLTTEEISEVKEYGHSQFETYDPVNGGGFTVLSIDSAKFWAERLK